MQLCIGWYVSWPVKTEEEKKREIEDESLEWL